MAFFGGGRGSGGFDDFIGGMHQQMFRHMQEMDNLMTGMMADPFSLHGPMLGRHMNPRERMIEDGHAASSSHQQQHQQVVPRMRRGPGMFGGFFDDDAMMPFGGGMLGGGMFGRMFERMEDMKEQAMSDPNSHVYSHSTVVSYDGTRAEPRYYEATNSVSKAGEVKEVKLVNSTDSFRKLLPGMPDSRARGSWRGVDDVDEEPKKPPPSSIQTRVPPRTTDAERMTADMVAVQ